MADWPIYQQARIATIGQGGSQSRGLTVTSSASTNTKGSWTQVTSATAFAASSVILTYNSQASSVRQLIDIGIGGSGSEQIVLADLHIHQIGANNGATVVLPLHIPAGVRVAVRSAASTASSVSQVTMHLLGGGSAALSPLSQITTYGAASGTSGGTAVDPGTTANTKGAWTQITSSTTAAHKGLFMVLGSGTTAGSASDDGFRVDIGVGASSSEQIIVPDFQYQMAFNGQRMPAATPVFPVDIPAGSRLAVRWQCGATGNARLGEVVLYGMS